MITLFPEELLDRIVKCIAADVVFIERQTTLNHWRYAREKLLSLSVANHRLRRICLPYLFGDVKIDGGGGAARLEEQCIANEAFALAIRSLRLSSFGSEPRDVQMFSLLLPHLRNLSQIIMDSVRLNMPMLCAINSHSVSTVVLLSLESFNQLGLPEAEFGPSDLKKILIFPTQFCCSNELNKVEKYISFGMQINHLYIKETAVLGGLFGARRFHGLRELHLKMDTSSNTLTWLPKFAQGHPLLQKISFSRYSVFKGLHRDPMLPFIEPFVGAITSKEGELRGFSITRTRPSSGTAGGSLEDWRLTGLYLIILDWSSGRILRLAHSFFPQIKILTMELPDSKSSLFKEELVSSLRRFCSLQVVGFHCAYRLLQSNDPQMPEPDHTQLEAAIIQYTSHIAQQIRSIESFFINGLQVRRFGLGSAQMRFLKGWLDVKPVDGTNERQTVGPLFSQARLPRRTEVSRAQRPDPSPPLVNNTSWRDFNYPFYI